MKNDRQKTLELLQQAGEIWKDVPGYENYQASTFGRIRSKNFYVNHPQGGKKLVRSRILKQAGKKYFQVSLNHKRSRLVHRIIALTFLENPRNLPCVNHMDGNPSNNYISNLEWCTYSENELHSFRVLGKRPNRTGLGKYGLENGWSRPIALIDSNGNIGKIYECSRFVLKDIPFLTRGGINSAARGNRKSHKGYFFKYLTRNEYFNLVKYI